MAQTEELRFIVDANAGKLAGWLRMMGYNTLFFNFGQDGEMIKIATEENRIIVTRDTRIMERRVVKTGAVRAVLLTTDNPSKQMRQLFASIDRQVDFRPFSLCISCNQLLIKVAKEHVREKVPAYVYKTQDVFYCCQNCERIFWRGTHWQAMKQLLNEWRGLDVSNRQLPN